MRKNSLPSPITFEQFMSLHGLNGDYDVQGHIHAGLRSVPDSKTYKRWYMRRLQELQDRRDAMRDQARHMYDEAIERGEIRKPTRLESLKEKAQGHPDNTQVMAARRLLRKNYGISF